VTARRNLVISWHRRDQDAEAAVTDDVAGSAGATVFVIKVEANRSPAVHRGQGRQTTSLRRVLDNQTRASSDLAAHGLRGRP